MNTTVNTNDPKLKSWVEAANKPGCDFPLQNLPYGVFRRGGSTESPRIGVAIGDQILDLRKAVDKELFDELGEDICDGLWEESLNLFMSLGREAWSKARTKISQLLRDDCPDIRDRSRYRKRIMVDLEKAEMLLPAQIGDYTDFYASIHHATNIGSMFRPDNPLMPNYRHLPVGYHGRASSVLTSGSPVTRPKGQTIGADADAPTYGPSKLLDYELEVGCFTGPGNQLGQPISIKDAPSHIFGIVLVNDWSARDIQKWEYQPLGPFNAKNFATTISPWVVTTEALEPYRTAQPKRDGDDPELLEYLKPTEDYAFDITLEVLLRSKQMRENNDEPTLVSSGNFYHMYWTFAQMLAHHSSTGCNMRPGDLLASGTVSGPDEDSRGCLLERTWRGENPIKLGDGSERKFLQDGDEVILRGWCEKDGAARIGFGECRGMIEAAK